MKIERLSPNDSRWRTVLTQVEHDVYHLPEYLSVSAKYESVEEDAVATAFYVHEGHSFCFIPMLIRRLPAALAAPHDWRDARSPYGYSAPLVSGHPAWIETAVDAFVRECRDQSIVSAFIRMHPLLGNPLEKGRTGQMVKHGETVYVDLTVPESVLWSQTRERLRSYIRRLQRQGFHVRFDDWATYPNFIDIYSETMERLQADQFYRFPPEYFRDLGDALVGRLHLCSVFDRNGELACGALLTETSGIVQYHLSGTTGRFLEASPSKLMLHEIILWARAAGHKLLHLGGGVGGHADSLLQFKAGFSPLRANFWTHHIVCDPVRYDLLCRQLPPEIASQDYFPKYRCVDIGATARMREDEMPHV